MGTLLITIGFSTVLWDNMSMTLRRGVRKDCKILSGSFARETLISGWLPISSSYCGSSNACVAGLEWFLLN